jgi:hypothetical protein
MNGIYQTKMTKKGGMTMCEKTCGCQNPVELKGRPEDCTPEQIRKCHGDDATHTCACTPDSTSGKADRDAD